MSKLPDHVGLDFGHHSVKAIQINDIGTKKPKLVNFGSQATPHGVINSEDEAHQKKLADALKALYDSSNIRNKKVVMAMPEYSVFTRFIEFVGIKEKELENAVYYEAKQYIPIPIDDVQMSFIKVGYDQARDAQKVLLVAAPRKIVDIYVNVVSKAGLDPLAIETESIAMGRAMYRATGEKHLLMLDFGSQSTDMSIMNDGYLVFSQSISIGSDSLTQAIVNKFNFEYNQAEEYKRNYGLTPDVLEGKIVTALDPIMQSIVTEILRGIEFYKSQTLLSAPPKCLLNGDGALLPGLESYLTTALSIGCKIADPFQNIEINKKIEGTLSKSKPSFSVAVGLGLKDRE
ncbi:type IV pilus assembly protein PilM [Candidatus Dojkabacteria bacterium]|nr:type IV pilus assembly protein PilM [Candidatus Dojkabacteria bacterium]